MGQQCCSDQKMDHRVYNHSRVVVEPKETKDLANNSNLALGYQGIDREYQFVRNFAAVDLVPKMHPNVKQIEQSLRPFKNSPEFKMPVGTKDPSAFAINNVGLIYDANSEWQDGLPHGNGKLIYPDGSIYYGSFIKGVPSGEGRFISSQGWYYEGELFKEQAQGKGVFAFERIGYRYQGEWQGDLPNGRGRQTWVKVGNVANYEGQYVSGKKHGKGIYKCGDDWVYEGDFSNNEMTSSKGIIRYNNGETYEGSFVNGKKHGFGIYRWKDGSVYEGWYSNDKKEGHGKFASSDGRKFQGEWLQGKREGRGLLIIGGKKYPGQWHNDLPSSNKNIT